MIERQQDTSQQSTSNNASGAKPYCHCWDRSAPMAWKQLGACVCGEENEVSEWKWENPVGNIPSWVMISQDMKQVTFHPFYSSGTAVVRGDSPFLHNNHYYWEVKMLTETYGTDIMIGIGTKKVNLTDSQFKFISLLGENGESYGLSYKGIVFHGGAATNMLTGFCVGSIIGVRLDMWLGTLEFYINRIPQGIVFDNLRRHTALFPMICSTAAQSSMRLTYSASWPASLLVDAARTLAASSRRSTRLPPGLWNTLRAHFWLTLPTQVENEDTDMKVEPRIASNNMPRTSGVKRRHGNTLS